jgi:hypothetical protein
VVPVLAFFAVFIPVFVMRALTNAPPGKVAPGQELALAVCLAAAGALVYGWGTRSMREAAERLGRPLRAYEHVFDFAGRSPFDSFCFVHLRWWGVPFLAASSWAIVRAVA